MVLQKVARVEIVRLSGRDRFSITDQTLYQFSPVHWKLETWNLEYRLVTCLLIERYNRTPDQVSWFSKKVARVEIVRLSGRDRFSITEQTLYQFSPVHWELETWNLEYKLVTCLLIERYNRTLDQVLWFCKKKWLELKLFDFLAETVFPLLSRLYINFLRFIGS